MVEINTALFYFYVFLFTIVYRQQVECQLKFSRENNEVCFKTSFAFSRERLEKKEKIDKLHPELTSRLNLIEDQLKGMIMKVRVNNVLKY